eukprot:CAMPEP_0202906886 /NCGR_PEP_ID=MMETSP1392-20130828/40604_1 /ASSEMBLY_ACC=CAM_ASM_000868 /TAXON_ID=225041 /ORGANISM="Chlamydomonas chlamydogama, Strain SAG 11-48b" /LENGTH=222 /DNA_ID=CAMNT_0049595567 /DNA_START=101 /DNA_END=770 /DNA_ORIENTATION=+
MASAMKMSKSSVSAGRRTEVAVSARQSLSCNVISRHSMARVATASVRPFGKAAPRAVVTRVSATAEKASPSGSTQTKEWYALVANAEFMFNDVQNESMAEQLRERVRFFKEQNRPIDFFFVPEPKWLDTKFPEQAKQVKRPCVALVSTDKQWIVFMKLRLDRCLRVDLGAIPDSEALAMGGQVPEFTKPMAEKWTAPYSRYAPGGGTSSCPSSNKQLDRALE